MGIVTKNSTMDPDKQNAEKENTDDRTDPGNVLQSIGIRYTICPRTKMDGFFSNYGPYFLFHFNILFFLILFYIERRLGR
jgi:hypothetical protein